MIKIILEQEEDQFDFDGDIIYTPKTDMKMEFTEEAIWPDIMRGLFKTLKLAGYMFDKKTVMEHFEELDDSDF